MKRFVAQVSGFLLLQGVFFAFLWNPDYPREQNYLAATIDKHHRLDLVHSPRIILVGGSNLAFGIKSDTLERELGRPVVNMGLNAALGIPFMLKEVESRIRTGDVVVLSLEYDTFAGTGVELVLRQLLELRPASSPYIPFPRWKKLSDSYGLSIIGGIARRTLLEKYRREPPLVSEFASYRRDLFDVQGSYFGHYGKPSTHPELHPITILGLSDANRARIARFARLCTARGAVCVFSCPPHPSPLLTPVPAGIQRNMHELRSISDLTLLNTPKDMEFPAEAFFDTCYHLVEGSATDRTLRLIEELRPFCSTAFKPH